MALFPLIVEAYTARYPPSTPPPAVPAVFPQTVESYKLDSPGPVVPAAMFGLIAEWLRPKVEISKPASARLLLLSSKRPKRCFR
ncbi:MAG TPA: hypothetical protein VHX88_18825 [Solirubrobacteraceae bacterium]|nr:hypothetical protein [Solirubrobacteraceae bacterium]